METPRSLIEKFSPKKRLLLPKYKKWTKEIKRRSFALGIQYPPFAVINQYTEALGSNGIALALRQAESDAGIATRTVWGGDIENELEPIDISSFRNRLRSERWNLTETTIIFLPIDEPISFEPLWDDYIQKIERRKEILETLNSEDIFHHLEEAYRLLECESPVDWGNAKGQARKALESLALGITGKTRVKELAKELQIRNLLGERETEWIERFSDFLGSTYSLGSKKGGHKPDPSQSDAKFFVGVANAVVEYVISLLLPEDESD